MKIITYAKYLLVDGVYVLTDERSHDYSGEVALCCLGPSAGLTATGKAQAAAYTTATNQAAAEFGSASTVFNDLMSSMAPIAKAGPGQTGWSAQEASAINAQTIDQTAASYKNAAAAVHSGEAAVGGGNIALPSGANLATEETLANEGAQTEASGLRANTIANYAQGNQNWQFAEGGLEKAPSVFDTANSATSASTNAGSASATTQNNITNANNSWAQLAVGALGAVASAAVPGGALTKLLGKQGGGGNSLGSGGNSLGSGGS